MSSNKAKAPGKESPTDPFKRAVAGCLRAIARKPDLEVGFAAERPGIVGGKARLPEPPRRLTAAEAAIVRGHADSMALKLACHDPKVHRKLVPGGQQARAVFDAIEQARLAAHHAGPLGREADLEIRLARDRPQAAGDRPLERIGRAFLPGGLGLVVGGHLKAPWSASCGSSRPENHRAGRTRGSRACGRTPGPGS